jgi:hypothetical protein
MKHITFNKKYFYYFLLFFNIEVAIALFSHTPFIRYFLGDVLVIILIYTFVKSIIKISVIKACFYVVVFSYLIEIFQYFNGIEILGIQNNTLARIIIGTTFTYTDLLAYTIGGVILFFSEYFMKNKIL